MYWNKTHLSVVVMFTIVTLNFLVINAAPVMQTLIYLWLLQLPCSVAYLHLVTSPWARARETTFQRVVMNKADRVTQSAIREKCEIGITSGVESVANFTEDHSFVKQLLLNYKKCFGDMLVPQRFVVPHDSDRWPSNMQNIKLGSIVHNLRSKYRKCKVDDNNLLGSGFSYDVQRPRYRTFRNALLCYQEKHGDMSVPKDFVIPSSTSNWPEELWGLNLGVIANAARDGAFRSNRNDLISIGFLVKKKPSGGYLLFRAALLKYKQIFENLLVPAPFVVPCDDDRWPQDLWNMKLGYYVGNVRSAALYVDNMDELKELGFVYDQQIMSFTFETLKAALYEYQDIEGNMNVPVRFIVPLNGSRNSINGTVNSGVWPEDTRGIRLGRTVSMIRCNRSYVEHREVLERIGLDYTPYVKANYGDYDLTRRMLLKFKDTYGDVRVDPKYVVPGDVPAWPSKWPSEMHGTKLGKIVSMIRKGKLFADRKSDLVSLGFEYDVYADDDYDALKEALVLYEQLYDSFTVPSDYVIPRKKVWPRKMWHMRLGSIVSSARNGFLYFEKKEELKKMGFDIGSRQSYSYNLIKRSLICYKELFGNMLVNVSFIVPATSEWLEEMWSIPLGSVVRDIRYGYAFGDKKQELQGLGFNFARKQTSEYGVFKNALIQFKQRYGDALVPMKYIMPITESEMGGTTYPSSLCLGRLVCEVRKGRKFSKYVEDLESIGFDFNTQIKYSYELTREMLVEYKRQFGHMVIPREFVIPDNEDWPEEMWDQKLGSIAELIRYGSYAERRQDLISIGFEYTAKQTKFDFQCVKIAVFKYREFTYGSAAVPQSFKIPHDSTWYPEETWGMPLGSIVYRIRSGEKWPEKKSELLG